MRILVAPQEFKGSLTAVEAARAMAAGLRRALPDIDLDLAPMADGGPGTVDALLAAGGGRRLTATVQDPLGRPVEAAWALFDDGTAVIEMAAASGLVLLRPEERDPRRASSSGTGQLIGEALAAGSRRLIVGLGGSATNDGGAGMVRALGVRFLDARGGELPPGGAALARLARIDVSGLDARLRGCTVLAATDVTNPLCGPTGTSVLYGPQKGATPDVAGALDRALAHYARVIERELGVAVAALPGAGAAGGLGAALVAFLGAEIRSGAELVADAVGLAGRIAAADLVVTGEGRLDAQTAFGKTAQVVASMAKEAGKAGLPAGKAGLPAGRQVLALAGTLAASREALAAMGIDAAFAVFEAEPPPEEMARAADSLSALAERVARLLAAGAVEGIDVSRGGP